MNHDEDQEVHIASVVPTFSTTERMKYDLSVLHIGAARDLAKACKEMEESSKQDESLNLVVQRQASAAVILAVAALESSINDIYFDAVHGIESTFQKVEVSSVKILAEIWPEVEKFSLLRKYQIALVACGKERMETGGEPYQSADALNKLRNALVHYKPEWDNEIKNLRNLESLLKEKFATNQISANANGHRNWLPGHCLGAGCALWACSVVQDFYAAFSREIGARNRFGS